MPKTIEPSIRQKTAFNKTLENIAIKKPVVMENVMIESGYSKATAINPYKNLISKKGWNELLAQIDDNKVLNNISKIANDLTDKRSALSANEVLLKLKDRFPAGKLKVQEYHEELQKYKEI